MNDPLPRTIKLRCVSMIGLPICVRELKSILLLRKENRDGAPV